MIAISFHGGTLSRGRYLGYDGVGQYASPVNQLPYLDEYQGHASRFAHQLDAALGHHSLYAAEEADRMVTLQTLSSMIGSAWIRYGIWEAIDPEEIVHGGNNDGVPLWKITLDENTDVDRRICGQCEIATFARRFYFHANLPLFRRLYRSGIIYSVDRDLTPWGAQIFDVATQPESVYYDALDAAYHAALAYYDNTAGAQRGV